MLNIAYRNLFAKISAQTIFFAPICERKKCIVPGGVHLKKFSDFWCFFGININPARFGVIEITHRSPAWPYSVSDFLPQTSFHILSQIVHIVFTLAKSNVQHKEFLRHRLAPKSRKFEGTNQAAVNHVDYLSAINRISRKTIRVP